MIKKYYLDTSIWIDLYEDRKGYCGGPLGDYAWGLLNKIKEENNILVISDVLICELENSYSMDKIMGMMKVFEYFIEKILSTEEQTIEAMKIAKERQIPPGDALHSILARDHKLILITRDNHFRELRDICEFYKPEEII